MNKNIQGADIAQVKKTGKRKEFIDLYGSSFGDKLTVEELLRRCNEQLEKCEKWTANLKALKAEKEAEIKAQRIEALKTSFSTMTADEKAEIINLLNL